MIDATEVPEIKKEFYQWVQEFDVFLSATEDNFDASKWDKTCIWSVVWDEESSIICGYINNDSSLEFPVIGYFVSKKPWVEENQDTGIKSSVFVACPACQGEYEAAETCVECDGD